MSTIYWLVIAVLSYIAHKLYNKLQYARKRSEYILDRRRAAGIPDNDKRPFAAARADVVKRLTERKMLNISHTPAQDTMPLNMSKSVNQATSAEMASRLSGIPGALPGYLRQTSAVASPKGTPSTFRKESLPDARTTPSTPPRHTAGPSNSKRNSSKKALKRELDQVDTDDEEDQTNTAPHEKRGASQRRAFKRRNERKASSNDSSAHDASMTDANSIGSEHSSVDDEEMCEIHSNDGEGATIEDVTMSEGSDRDMADAGSDTESNALATFQKSAPVTGRKRDVEDARSLSSRSPSTDVDEPSNSYKKHEAKRKKTSVMNASESKTNFDAGNFQPETVPIFRRPGSGTAKRALDTSDDHEPGDEWVDYEGLRWRIDPASHELQRLTDVLEWRSKYKMPKDSMHPMAKERHQVTVSKWLTKDDWEAARAKRLLTSQEAERQHEKERQDKEAEERLRRKQELLAKIRQTSSPNQRLNSYLASKQRGSQSLVSESSITMDPDRSAASIDSISQISDSERRKPSSRRISLTAANTPKRGGSPLKSSPQSLRSLTMAKNTPASPLNKATIFTSSSLK